MGDFLYTSVYSQFWGKKRSLRSRGKSKTVDRVRFWVGNREKTPPGFQLAYIDETLG